LPGSFVTDINIYLRLLYARVGSPNFVQWWNTDYKSNCGRWLMCTWNYPEKTRMQNLATYCSWKKRQHKKYLNRIQKWGYVLRFTLWINNLWYFQWNWIREKNQKTWYWHIFIDRICSQKKRYPFTIIWFLEAALDWRRYVLLDILGQRKCWFSEPLCLPLLLGLLFGELTTLILLYMLHSGIFGDCVVRYKFKSGYDFIPFRQKIV